MTGGGSGQHKRRLPVLACLEAALRDCYLVPALACLEAAYLSEGDASTRSRRILVREKGNRPAGSGG